MNTENQASEKSIEAEKASTTSGKTELKQKQIVTDDSGGSRTPTAEDRDLDTPTAEDRGLDESSNKDATGSEFKE